MTTNPMPDPDTQHHEQFLRLFAEHEPAMRTLVRAMVPSLADASEIMQEAAVVLWQKFDEFDATREFRPWACGIARNKALAFLRDRKRDRHVFNEELTHQLADEAMEMDQRHEGQREALDKCLRKLPAPQRELVLAAYTKGTRMDELATDRGQTAMSLYKVLHRIRQALLECVRRTIAKGEPA
jgi:RNA polymerase sigma-70 factor (ECF subfamily)